MAVADSRTQHPQLTPPGTGASSGLGFALAALVADLPMLILFVGSEMAGDPWAGTGIYILVLFVLPPVSLVLAVLAIRRGRRGRDRGHRTAFWLGLAVLLPALAAGALGLVLLVGEALFGG